MLRFLEIIRRIFIGGIVSLLIVLIGLGTGVPELVLAAKNPAVLKGAFSLFFLISPACYFILLLISCVIIRQHVKYAAVHQQKIFMYTVLLVLGGDLAFPFKNIAGLFQGNKDRSSEEARAKGKRRAVIRTVEMVILAGVCVFGLFMI
ncbi:MAG: hypothetical protein IKF16_01995 [Lachnospiraceae bacterium]|nr:hypothetical protein [Lachnospiraceae bacterium]